MRPGLFPLPRPWTASADLRLPPQPVELRMLARIATHRHWMERDAASGVFAESGDRGDAAAVPHGWHGELVEQAGIDEPVRPAGNGLADPVRELRAAPHHEVGVSAVRATWHHDRHHVRGVRIWSGLSLLVKD